MYKKSFWEKTMNKFKTKKINYFGKNAYLYRGFIIVNDYQFYQNMQIWRIYQHNDAKKYISSERNKRECMEWVDEYYEEMNDYNNAEI